MAPRWLSPRQSSWGTSTSERTYPLKTLVFVSVMVLILGAASGFALAGGDSAGSATRSPASPGNTSAPAADDIALIGIAERSEDGAVKAATGFITGLPSAALLNSRDQARVLDDVLDPSAPNTLRQRVTTDLAAVATSLRVNGQERRVSVVSTPASYKVEYPANSNTARVTVWYLTVILDATNETVRSEWSTAVVTLNWTDHWRVREFTTAAGPSPQVFAPNSQFSSYDQVANVFNGFRAYRYATAQ